MYRRIVMLLTILLLLCTGCLNSAVPYSEITVSDETFADKFYFSQLNEEEQLIYKEIYQGILEQQEEIYVHSEEAEMANSIYECVVYDFGEIFWTDGKVTSTLCEQSYTNELYTIVKPSYTFSEEERTERETEIESAVSQIINQIPQEYTEYEKIKYIYEYLIDNVNYNEEAPDNQTLYSALVGKETVCAGYAKANQYLLNQLGIYCIYVTGSTTWQGESESHAWNIVRCNGNYYYVDVTWADPLALEETLEEQQEIQLDVQTEPIYDYLCCSESEMADTHVKNETYDYPECVSDDLDYYRSNQMFYDSLDEQRLLNAMYESIDEKETSTMFKFSDSALYTEGKALVLERLIQKASQHLGERYGLREVTCTYEEQPQQNKLVIYWFYEL